METLLLAFLPQCETLMHAKTVLFIDDDQRKAVELHLFLEDRVRPHHHLYLSAGDSVLLRQTSFPFLFARQPADFNAKRGKPVAEVVGMLFRQ